MSTQKSRTIQYGGLFVRFAGWKITLIVGAIVAILFLIAPFILFFNNEPDISGKISQSGMKMIPPQFIEIYKKAGEKYGVPWNLLAAHHYVETSFSKDLRTSYTGAVGHLQFEPCSWLGWKYPGCKGTLGNLPKSVDITNPSMINKYGGYGVDANGDGKADPNDVEDAIYALAKYLAANGAANGKLEEAVFSYNHDPAYVSKVLKYAQLFVEAPTTGTVVPGGKLNYPVPAPLHMTSGFGMRFHPILKVFRLHEGQDFGKPIGTPVFAAGDGQVSFSGVMGGYGNVIIINHGNGLTTRYAHLNSRSVSEGQPVKSGTIIGTVGTTGLSTGAHLHFETRINDRPIDPMQFLKK